MNVAGKLLYGIERDEKTHVDFTMRESTIRDVIAASDKLISDGENGTSNLVARIYTAAEQIETLGELPKAEITGALLLSLPEDDIWPLLDAQDTLKKKRSNANPS